MCILPILTCIRLSSHKSGLNYEYYLYKRYNSIIIVVTKFNNQSHTHNLYRWPPQHAITSYSTAIYIAELNTQIVTSKICESCFGSYRYTWIIFYNSSMHALAQGRRNGGGGAIAAPPLPRPNPEPPSATPVYILSCKNLYYVFCILHIIDPCGLLMT
jgi:hypothetical protein